ncbi:MAG: WYL domain-containing protein [Jiangellales bacterium]
MATAYGRDQMSPMERLTQILSMLAGAPGRTLAADQILDVVPFGAADRADQRDQLRRDMRHLETLGWQIDNVAGEGEAARYRLTAIDNRLRVEFTPPERAELLRAASAASLAVLFDDLGDAGTTASAEVAVVAEPEPAELGLVQRAVAQHCLLRFTYRDKPREVHPHGLHVRPGGWYLTAVETGATDPKTFVVGRMSEVAIDSPGSARVPEQTSRPQLDPITWAIDEPVDVVVRTTPEHQTNVEGLLGRASATDESGADVVLTIPVTHRLAFRRRLYELGTRVVLVGPDEVRDEVRAELEAVAGPGR